VTAPTQALPTAASLDRCRATATLTNSLARCRATAALTNSLARFKPCPLIRISLSLQSLANNEFQSSRYSAPVPGSTIGETQGQFFMNQYSLLFSRVAQWGGIAIILGLWVLLGWIAALLALNAFRFDVFPGTVRRPAMLGPPPGSILAASGLSADTAEAQQPLQVPLATEAAAAGGAAVRQGEPAAVVTGAATDGGSAAKPAAGTADGSDRATATHPSGSQRLQQCDSALTSGAVAGGAVAGGAVEGGAGAGATARASSGGSPGMPAVYASAPAVAIKPVLSAWGPAPAAAAAAAATRGDAASQLQAESVSAAGVYD